MMDLDTVCRLCSKELCEDEQISLFDKKTEFSLSDMVFFCATIVVRKGDGLPDKMCQNCAKKLEESFQFRTQVKEADKYLRKTFSVTRTQTLCEKEQPKSALQKVFEVPTGKPPIETNSSEINRIKQKIYRMLGGKPSSIRSQLFKSHVKSKSRNHSNIKKENKEVKKKGCKEARIEVSVDVYPPLYSVRRIEKVKQETTLEETEVTPKKKLKPEKPTFYTCQYCSKVYPSEGGWRYHVYTMHNRSYQPFMCDICGKAFKVKKNLEAHKNAVHYKIKPCICELCGKAFSTKYALRSHNLWHTGEKNFSCEICGFRFSSIGKLNIHSTTHGGPKKFMCEVCSRDFRWKKDFEIHMRTHTGEKPFQCGVCGKAFSSATNMKKHEKGHSGSESKMTRPKRGDPQTSDPVYDPGFIV